MKKLILFFFTLSAYAHPPLRPLDDIIPRPLRMNIEARRRHQTIQAAASPNLGPDREKFLMDRDSPVKMQFGGTCTTFGLLASVENLLGGKLDLSERYFWNLYRKYSAYAAIETANRHLILGEKGYFPPNGRSPASYSIEGSARVIDAPYLGDDIPEMLSSIDHGWPVYIAMSVLKGLSLCHTVVNPMSPITKDGHALEAVGYSVNSKVYGGGYLLAKNSWGTNCGKAGYQWIPFSVCTRPGSYCAAWSIRNARPGRKGDQL